MLAFILPATATKRKPFLATGFAFRPSSHASRGDDRSSRTVSCFTRQSRIAPCGRHRGRVSHGRQRWRSMRSRTTFYLHFRSQDDLLMYYHETVVSAFHFGPSYPRSRAALLTPDVPPGIIAAYRHLLDARAPLAASCARRACSYCSACVIGAPRILPQAWTLPLPMLRARSRSAC